MKQIYVITAIFLSLLLRNLQGQCYQVVDLGALGAGGVSGAYAISSAGQMAGFVNPPSGGTYAFLYTNGQMQNIGGNTAYGYGVNSNGQVVGVSGYRGYDHAFIYSNGVMQDVGTLGGNNSEFLAINDNGVAVGSSETGIESSPYHAVVYSSAVMHDIGNLGYDYDYDSFATAINNNGQITGYADTPSGAHAFLYSNGSMQDLGTFPGGEQTFASGVNNSGQVVGIGDIAVLHNSHAFLYANGQMQDLGTVGGVTSQACGMNDSGQVVGSATDTNGNDRAFLYSNGSMWDLNSLINTNSGWTLMRANAINNAGQIVGYGNNPSGQQHAYLLNPINPPEPIITRQPTSSQTVAIGSTVCLTVRTTNEPIYYQWYFGTNAIVLATNSWLTLTNVQQGQSGTYTVTLAYAITLPNQNGTTTSNPAMLNVLPGLGINMIPGITIAGQVGLTYELEYVNVFGPTNNWQPLAAITITNNPQWYFDVSAIGQPQRFYQLLQVQ